MNYRATISNEDLATLPPGAFEGKITVVDTPAAMALACAELGRETVIGFDTETRPSFQKGKVNPVALMQLASARKAYLFRVNRIRFSPEMVALLENEKITKVGASIRDDLKILQHITPFRHAGFVDIQHIVGRYGITDLSVRKVSAIVLGIRISKAQRLSNWEAHQLTEAQQLYAATDAWVCREIFLKLTGRAAQPERKKFLDLFRRKRSS